METKNTSLPSFPSWIGVQDRLRRESGRNGKRFSGFTLVELIVVITILVILGTIAFVSLGGFAGSARDSSRVSDLSLLSKGLDIYFVKNGNYPDPTSSTGISYSGGVLWKQWTIGESVILSLGGMGARVSKKPTDPLSSAEYAYSITTESKEYSLKSDYEGSSVAYVPSRIPLLTSPDSGEELSFSPPTVGGVGGGTFGLDTIYAETGNPTIAYIKGNYNGVAAKVTVGSPKTVYLLSVPNIITTASHTGITVGSSQNFIVNGQNNTGGVSFIPKILYQSGSLPTNDTEKALFASGIVSAYSGTVLASATTIASFIQANGNTGTLANLGGGLQNRVWGGASVSAATIATGPSITCTGTNVTQTDLGGGHGQCVFAYAGTGQTATVVSGGGELLTINAWWAGGWWCSYVWGGAAAGTITGSITSGQIYKFYVGGGGSGGTAACSGGGGWGATYAMRWGSLLLVLWGGGGWGATASISGWPGWPGLSSINWGAGTSGNWSDAGVNNAGPWTPGAGWVGGNGWGAGVAPGSAWGGWWYLSAWGTTSGYSGYQALWWWSGPGGLGWIGGIWWSNPGGYGWWWSGPGGWGGWYSGWGGWGFSTGAWGWWWSYASAGWLLYAGSGQTPGNTSGSGYVSGVGVWWVVALTGNWGNWLVYIAW